MQYSSVLRNGSWRICFANSNARLIGVLQEDKEEGLAMLTRDPLAIFSASTAREVRLILSENRPNLNNSKRRTFGTRIVNICLC